MPFIVVSISALHLSTVPAAEQSLLRVILSLVSWPSVPRCTQVKKGHLIRCEAGGADAKNLPQKCFAGSVHSIEMRRNEVTRGLNVLNQK